jgi:hypothetical protein
VIGDGPADDLDRFRRVDHLAAQPVCEFLGETPTCCGQAGLYSQ